MGGEEVVELSVAETQALRAELGLPPLRGVPGGGSGGRDSAVAAPSTTAHATAANNNEGAAGSSKEELSLSVDETNALRAKIGLAPLKTAIDEKKAGSSASTAIHAKPTDTGAESEAQKRIEDAAARREAKERLQKLEEEGAAEEKGGGSALDFAAKMRAGKIGATDGDKADKGKKKRKKKKKLLTKNPQLSLPGEDEEEESAEYTSSDLKGMKVAHSAADFAAGSTAVLTLADTSILEVDPDSNKVTGFGEENNELVNATMEGETRALENLRRKRQVELGAGRAGGYAGYDDDEFEETGGVGLGEGRGPLARSLDGGGRGKRPGSKGFAIGADGTVQQSKDESKKSDLFSALGGGAVSLQSRHAHKIASDFVAHDDEDEEREERLRKEKARHVKMLEKMRRKDKKKLKKAKKKGRRERSEDSDDDDEEEGKGGGGGLLESLEATAVKRGEEGNGRKRRRRNGDDAMDVDGKATGSGDEDVDEEAQRRKRFDEIMDKGRARTDRAFKKPLVSKPSAALDDAGDEEGEDDAFLNAALAKARRLKRLKEMSGAKSTGGGAGPAKGEAAVVQAVEKMKREEAAKEDTAMGGTSGEQKGRLTFEFDEVQEFTRALRAREEREKRSGGAEQSRRGVKVTTAKEKKVTKSEENAAATEEAKGQVEDVDMQELAEEMKDDDDDDAHPQHDDADAFGSTAESAPVGRGMAGFLSLLKRTGEISQAAAREEMRGRAKDERTYDDYAKLDLDKVVQANTSGRNAHEKDVELANREIKLEYRDEFGRLLTRKEAYREMCYQFHGHGSSKKNQERRLKKIEREQEEKSAVARGGTFGALKKTQEATGSAFVVHKT